MAGPLTGYRIIEIAGIGPGPFAAMLLADMGAEVVRVERAGAVRGPAPDTPHPDILRRGRRNIALDLKHRMVLIMGTAYAGEIKKSIFTALNYILPEKGGQLPVLFHC